MDVLVKVDSDYYPSDNFNDDKNVTSLSRLPADEGESFIVTTEPRTLDRLWSTRKKDKLKTI
jgi:hypothetical protein